MIPLAIPAAGPLFEGHFPGRPILPGIGLLHLALRALGDPAGDGALRGIDHFKWRSIVVPGERLALVAKASGDDGTTRLEVRRGPEVVAGGAVTLGHPTGEDAAPASPGPGAASAGIPSIDRLLPHGAPMRFVSKVEADLDDGIECAANVPPASPFAPVGTAPAFVAIEMAAQAAAVFEALRRSRAMGGGNGHEVDRAGGAGPRLGYLVGARGVRFLTTEIPAGAECRVAIRLDGVAGALSSYRFEVARGRTVAAGTLSTWITTTDA